MQLRASGEPGLYRVTWNVAVGTDGGGFGGMGKGGFKSGKGKGQPGAGKSVRTNRRHWVSPASSAAAQAASLIFPCLVVSNYFLSSFFTSPFFLFGKYTS